MANATHPGHFGPWEETQHLLYRRLGGPQGRSENVVPTGIRSPDCPSRSESLYRLSYLTPLIYTLLYQNIIYVFVHYLSLC